MKKRFLDRFACPYLEKRVPENIVPGRVLSNKRIKSLLKSKTLRSMITSESPSVGWGRGVGPHTTVPGQRILVGNKISNRSPGLRLRLIKGTLRLHKSKLEGEKAPWLRIDTLERGSLASAVHSPLRVKLGDVSPTLCGPQSSKVWDKTLPDGGATAPSLEEPKGAAVAFQAGRADPIAEGHYSLYSSTQLEEGLARQQERRPSPLLLKLMERNKLRIMYGNMANREVDKLINRGFSSRGGMSDSLFKLLESRIDVFLCRVGFFATIPCARQRIHYGKVLINQKITTTASHMLKPGDIVSISTCNLASLRESLQERSSKLPISLCGESAASLPSHELPPLRGSGKAKQRGIQLQNEFSKLVGLASYNNATGVSPYRLAELARRVPDVARRERLRWFSLKPTYAEISYRCLTAIYLYPPQQVLLPAMVDIEKISKS